VFEVLRKLLLALDIACCTYIQIYAGNNRLFQIKLQLHFLEAQNWEYKPKQCIMKNELYNPLIILLDVVSNKPSTTKHA
jgi:hypothetical protein